MAADEKPYGGSILRWWCALVGHDWEWNRARSWERLVIWFSCDRCGLVTPTFTEELPRVD